MFRIHLHPKYRRGIREHAAGDPGLRQGSHPPGEIEQRRGHHPTQDRRQHQRRPKRYTPFHFSPIPASAKKSLPVPQKGPNFSHGNAPSELCAIWPSKPPRPSYPTCSAINGRVGRALPEIIRRKKKKSFF